MDTKQSIIIIKFLMFFSLINKKNIKRVLEKNYYLIAVNISNKNFFSKKNIKKFLY